MTAAPDPVRAHRDDGPAATTLAVPAPVPPVVVAAAVVVAALALVGVVVAGAGRTTVLAVGVVGLLLALLRPSGARGPRTAWTVPPALRAWEYALVVALGARADPTVGAAMAFVYVFAVGYHHYDVVYRLRHRGVAPARWLTWSLGGWELRAAAVLAAWAADATVVVLAAVGAWCGLLAIGESILSWRRADDAAALPAADPEEFE